MIEQTPVGEETPIACKLTREELAERGSAVKIFEESEQIRELDDGYAFCFSDNNNLAARLLAHILEERLCCPFFTFELVFEPNEGPIWLSLRGSAAIKEFVAANAGDKILAAHA
jgi:hypothetical protein